MMRVAVSATVRSQLMRPTETQSRPEAGSSLDYRTQLNHDLRRVLREPEAEWSARWWPDAGEAVLCKLLHGGDDPPDLDPESPDGSSCSDLEEEEREAQNWNRANRRAFANSRRYFVANRLRYQWVLTFEGDGLHGPEGRARCMHLVALFIRRFKRAFGEMPWWFSPELHPDGHGWHVNLYVPKRLPHDRMAALWRHGFVFVSDKLRHPEVVQKGLPFVEALRLACLYACKYASKDWSRENVPDGVHRFECAVGFQPREESLRFMSAASALRYVESVFGRQAEWVWSSMDEEEWDGPPAMCLRWSSPLAVGADDG